MRLEGTPCQNRGMKAVLGEGGRLVIPVAYRRAMGVRPGDEVVVRVVDGEVRISSARRAIQRAQELVRRYVSRDRSLADELLRERRTEAERE